MIDGRNPKMKRERELIELSEDEWSPHTDSFKPSRVLKPKPTSPNPPPPIESFAFSKTHNSSNAVHIIESSSSDELGIAATGNGNEFEDLEDEDADMEVSNRPSTVTRVNRFVIDDDDDDDDDEHGNGKVDEFGDDEAWSLEEEEEEDVVKKALRKCEKISAELKQELYGSTSAACDRYSEVELGPAAARIVTQVIILMSSVSPILYIGIYPGNNLQAFQLFWNNLAA